MYNTSKNIKVGIVVHRGEKRIRLVFDYDDELIGKVKTIPGRAWSQTMGCWHVPYDENSIRLIKQYFPNNFAQWQNSLSDNKKAVDILILLARTNDSIYIRFPNKFNKDWIHPVKKCKYRKYDAESKMWQIKYIDYNFNELKQSFEKMGCRILVKHQTEPFTRNTKKTQKVIKDRYCPQLFLDELKRRNYSSSTISNYKSQIDYFLYYFKEKPAEKIENQEIKKYLTEQIEKYNASYSTQNVMLNAIKLFYKIANQREIQQ